MKKASKTQYSGGKTGPLKTAEPHGSKKKTAALNTPNITELRQLAEARLKQEMGRLDELYNQDTKQIIHELGRYQIELEMQNEELRRTQAELEASHLKYVDLYEFAPVGYFTLTPKGIIKSVNQTGADMLGTTKKELVKKRFSVFVHENDADTFYLFARRTIREEAGQKHITEVRFQTNDGTILHVQLEGITFIDDAGNVYEMRVIATDITEHAEAEKTIRQLARFPAENPFPVIRLNKEGVILYANKASTPLLESWGVDVDELLPEEIRRLAIDVFSSGTAREIEQICEDRTMVLNLVPIYEGNFVNIYAIDITDRKRAEDIILKSETQLKTTLNNLNEGVIVSDLKGDLIYWNHSAIKEFGYSSEEEYLRNFRDFKTSLELSTSEDGVLSVERWPLNRIIQGETLRNWEVDVRWRDSNRQRTYNFGGTLVRDKDGNPWMAILTLLDITNRKVLTEKILQAKQEWERTFDAVPDLIAILDTDYKILRVNKAMAEKVSLHPKELLGKKCFSVMHGISEPLENCPFTLTQVDNREHSFEFEDSHLGGYYHVTTTPLYDGQGNLVGIIHVSRDITELKETEEALRQAHKKLEERYAIKIESLKESEIRYSSLVQALLTGVFICIAGKIVFVNNQFSKMFGYENLELINRKIMELIHPGDREFFIKMIDTSAQTGIHEESYEIRGIRKNAGVVHLLGRSTIIELKDQVAILGNFLDITIRKKSEQKLRKSEEELREVNVKLKHLSSQLLTAQETERSRISRELHDEVGGSLALIKLRISAIEKKLQPDQETIREECRQNMQYIDQLSENVQRVSRDLSPAILEDLGLTPALNWLVNNFIKYHSINVAINVENVDHLFSKSDQIMIYRTIQEGMTNIAKHAQAQNVAVEVWIEGDQIFVRIEDDGRGFETTGLEGINNLEKGMGMATMNERARMLGGILNLWSEQGKGTRINLSIPIKDGAEAR